MKKSAVVALHIAFWVCYLILIFVIIGMLYGREESVDEARIQRAFEAILMFALLPSILSFYSFYLFIFPKFFQQKRFIETAMYGTLVAVLSAGVGYLLLREFYGELCTDSSEDNEAVGALIFMSLVTEISGVIALMMKGFITWFEELKLREELTKKNHETELALIKSQLDPHFLFNTINNIDVLILKDADKASDYLNKLSDIMRFMLYETKSDEISLQRELEYIEKYIQLQRIRTANANYIQLQVEGNLSGHLIAPMLFIPFIENAVKHATNKKVNNAVDIHIKIETNGIWFECKNSFNPLDNRPKKDGGLGNELIQKRLNLLYPERHSLKVVKNENQYHVSLRIDHG
jgi:sensor histidine kinase YesM